MAKAAAQLVDDTDAPRDASEDRGRDTQAIQRFSFSDRDAMTDRVFNRFRELIYEEGGISLSDRKRALLCTRVGKRMRALGLRQYRDYLDMLSEDDSGLERVHLLDAISTNVTHFFRESSHFAFLTEMMKTWLAAGQTRFRFWSAGCSTGEEPYSIAMTLLEETHASGLNLRILATDISTQALFRAMEGMYPKRKMATVPALFRKRYFTREGRGDETVYFVQDRIKKMILFQRINLSTPPFPMKGPLDMVFLRNVMIYFDNDVRRRLLKDVYRMVKPGGYLIVGHAESLTGMISDFKLVRPSIFVKK